MGGETSKITAPYYTPPVAIFFGLLTVGLIRGATGVHIPLLAATLAGLILGVLDPHKGWISALVQVVVITVGLFALIEGELPEIERHSLLGAVGLTFIGSFIGAFIKRAFKN